MKEANDPLQVLIVEDSENDALLAELELQRAGYDCLCHRVDTTESMSEALENQAWDVVIADYAMPHFTGLDALALVKEKALDLPFIIVSAVISEDTAVAAMKAGAHDYVMKDKLARLGPAIGRELREAELRRQRRRSEQRLQVEHAVTRVIANAGSLTGAGPELVQLLMDAFHSRAGVFWLLGAGGESLHPFVIQLREPSPELRAFEDESRKLTVQPGVGLPGRVWQQHAAAWTADLSHEPGVVRRQAAERAGLRSAMAFPIQSSNEFLGVIEIFGDQALPEDPDLLNMLAAIGSEIGQFIKRRRAEEDLRRAHDELELRVQQRTAELKTANVRLEAAIKERQQLEHELLEITEKERRRIGLDLHDDLGQKLSGIAMMTKGLENKLMKTRAAEAEDAARIHTLVQEALSHARGLARDLATLDPKQKDLAAALSELAGRVKDLFQISCKFKTEGHIPPLDAGVVGQLYKIAQEAVTNAIKHGKAKKVNINLEDGAERILLTVQNDGLPFPDLEHRSTGMGMRIMNYRASLIGASLDIKGIDHGTRVTCAVPLGAK